MWSIPGIADAIQSGLQVDGAGVELEQAVYGLDANNELGLHKLLERSLQSAGYGVYREQRYPTHRSHRRRSVGARCDIVLTPTDRPLATPDELPTLFDPPNPVPLAEAMWIEVKVVAQFTISGPNRRYSALLGAMRNDIIKLSAEPEIRHAAVLILLFAQDQSVAEHDLDIWHSDCRDRGLAIGEPEHRHVTVGDRLGNAVCRVALFPVTNPSHRPP